LKAIGAAGAISANVGHRVIAIPDLEAAIRVLRVNRRKNLRDDVYNHTAEGSPDGPTLSRREPANHVYYILDQNAATYADYTGCRNTFDAAGCIWTYALSG
jgi:glycogen operon protein